MSATAYAAEFFIAAGESGKGPLKGLAPKTPAPPQPKAMPDQSSILQGSQLSEAQASSLRRGRASTILTNNADTGDKLGP